MLEHRQVPWAIALVDYLLVESIQTTKDHRFAPGPAMNFWRRKLSSDRFLKNTTVSLDWWSVKA